MSDSSHAAGPAVSPIGLEFLDSGSLQACVARVLADEIVAGQVAPGASAAVARYEPEERLWRWTCAHAGVRSPTDSTPIRDSTRFDLASLTKPVFTVALTRHWLAEGKSLEMALGDALPLARGSASERATFKQLLSHRAGLLAHQELFAPLRDVGSFDAHQALERAANSRREECFGDIPEHGFPALYSDLGFILAGAAVPVVTGLGVDVLIERQVTVPLGLEFGSARIGASKGWQPDDYAPTETVAWRGGELTGVVHDDNAWALARLGCAGHAGLFGTSRDVLGFACATLDAVRGRAETWLPLGVAESLTAPRSGGSLRTGFDGISATGSSAGSRFGPCAIGHLGFTGTSFWGDPEAEIAVVLLTNRVCPSSSNVRLRELRPLVHSALFDCATRLGP